jgi:integrase
LFRLRALNPKAAHVCPAHDDRRRRWWDEVREDAGTVDFHWHDLRHTFASRLVMNGVDILTVNKLLRHSHKTLQVTMRYAHLADTRLHKAVAKLEGGSVTGSVTAPQRVSATIQ